MEGRPTHLAYKAEHVVDLDGDLVLAAEIGLATAGDAMTLPDSLVAAQLNLKAAGSKTMIEEAAGDKGIMWRRRSRCATTSKCEHTFQNRRRRSGGTRRRSSVGGTA